MSEMVLREEDIDEYVMPRKRKVQIVRTPQQTPSPLVLFG